MTRIYLLLAPLVGTYIVLNALGGIVSGIWLAAIGEWWAIGIGLAGVMSSHWVISMLLLPSILLSAPAVALQERGRLLLASLVAALANLYISALMAAWGAGVFLVFATSATTGSTIPLLIWGYGVTSGPWVFFVSKTPQEGGENERSFIATFFLQVGYIAAALILLAGGSYVTSVLAVTSAMAVNWGLQMIMLRKQML